MENDWLEMKNEKDSETKERIDCLVNGWQTFGTGEKKISIILDVLSNRIMNWYPKTNLIKKDAHREEMVRACMCRLNRIDTSKDSAFNYFTTIMIATLRQLTTTTEDMKQMKEKYHEYLASNGGRNRNKWKTKKVSHIR